MSRKETTLHYKTFMIKERGHRRHIVAEKFQTRVLSQIKESGANNEQTAEKESI